ncbi:unnamed protein product [Calypogeia fissa]
MSLSIIRQSPSSCTLRVLCNRAPTISSFYTSLFGWSQISSQVHISCSPFPSNSHLKLLSSFPSTAYSSVVKSSFFWVQAVNHLRGRQRTVKIK